MRKNLKFSNVFLSWCRLFRIAVTPFILIAISVGITRRWCICPCSRVSVPYPAPSPTTMTTVMSKGEQAHSFLVASTYWAAKTSSLAHSDRSSTNGWAVNSQANTSRTLFNTRDVVPNNTCRILVVGEKFHSAGITHALEKAGHTGKQIMIINHLYRTCTYLHANMRLNYLLA